MSWRLGIDVGGTFTDFVLFDEETDRITLHKVPSTPVNPALAIERGIGEIVERGRIETSEVSFLIHGTTVATNAILERKGAKTALIVTEGFQDILHIMRQDRPKLYDFRARRPDPLVPRRLRFEVPERMLYTGAVHRTLDESALKRIADILSGRNVRALAVCLLHSYANPVHERRVREIVGKCCPELSISLSSEILPEFKEYERMSTTVINAYVLPVLARYLQEVRASLTRLGIGASLHVMKSNGGVMSASTAQKESIHTILSGPAGGVLGGVALAKERGSKNAITVDMGGTSFDICLTYDGRMRFSKETEIGGHAVRSPMIDIHTIGAGGGSIAWIDAGGAPRVGPQSAGADPGPACYGLGGIEPTVTDANVVLGRLSPERFLGGEMPIDPELAFRALEEKVAGPLEMTVEQAAEGIIRVVNAAMVKGIRYVSVERGYDPREFVLVPFGGAGPLHAVELAKELSIPEVVVPIAPGVASARGLLMADFRKDYVKTYLRKLDGMDFEELNAVFGQVEREAFGDMVAEHIPADRVSIVRTADVRYIGQGYELEIPVPRRRLREEDMKEIKTHFDTLHERSYGFSREDQDTEIVNLRVAAIGRIPKLKLRREDLRGSDVCEALREYRSVYLEGRSLEIPIYDREKLQPGNSLEGPAIVEQRDSTTLIFERQRAEVDPWSNIVIQIS